MMNKRAYRVLCVFVLAVVSGPGVLQGDSSRTRQSHDFVDAVAEARRRLAVIEPVSATRGIVLPVATGVFVTEEGDVLTSITAVAGANEIFVRRLQSRRYKARIRAVDQVFGLVFLETLITMEIPFEESARPAQPGELVIAAFAIPGESDEDLTMGVLPAVITSDGASVNIYGRTCEPMLKLDSRAPAGSATAPVFNSAGRFAGLLIAVRNCSSAPECSYVLPEQTVREISESLSEGISRRLSWLGVALERTPRSMKGVRIAGVMRDCPADAAGLEPGDVILSVDGRTITDPVVLRSIIGSAEPEQEIEVEVQRDGRLLSFSVTLGRRPLMISASWQGDTDQETAGAGER